MINLNKFLKILIVLALFFLTLTFSINLAFSANQITATIKVGKNPRSLAVNSVTNTIYVANSSDDTVTVIAGELNSVISTIEVGDEPVGIAVNETTGFVYIVNKKNHTVSILDGQTNTIIEEINVSDQPESIAVNKKTNLIYVVTALNIVNVIGGTSNEVVTTINVDNQPGSLSINDETNLIYITNFSNDSVTIIDGALNKVIKAISVGNGPLGIVVDSTNNIIYVTNFNEDSVSVISGATDTLLGTISVGNGPASAGFNSEAGFLYIADSNNDTLSIIDVSVNEVVSVVEVGNHPISVGINSATGLVYTANLLDDSVSVMEPDFNSGVPSLSSITPFFANSGVNVAITLTGDNFTGESDINITGKEITITDIIINSSTSITATFNISPFATADVHAVTVTTVNGLSNPVEFISGGKELITILSSGTDPLDIDVNTVLNQIYVCNSGDDTLSVIDGNSNTISATILVGVMPVSVSVDQITNNIYAANQIDNTVSVIDGTVNSVFDTIVVGNKPSALEINELTSRLYVTNSDDDTLTIISAGTNTVLASIDVGDEPVDVACNAETNQIYVSNRSDGTVSVIDGNTNSVIQTVQIGSGPGEIEVNVLSNTIYVVHNEINSISIIDGEFKNIIKTMSVANSPVDISINPSTNLAYVTHENDKIVSVIDLNTNSVITSTIGNGVVSVNHETDIVYLASFEDDRIFVLKDVAMTGNPLLTSIIPRSGFMGEVTEVTLNGANFSEDMAIDVSGDGILVSNLIFGSSTTAMADFNVSSEAITFSREVDVTTSVGRSNSLSFEVLTSISPELISILPDSAFQGETVNVLMAGQNFSNGMVVNVSGTGINVQNFKISSSSTATAALEITGDAELGVREVSVKTESGGESNILEFTVLPLIPVLNTIFPDSATPGDIAKVNFSGKNFTENMIVDISGTGITIRDLIVSSNISADAIFNVDKKAKEGERSVSLLNINGKSNSLDFSVTSKPVADFSMDKRFGKSPMTVNFKDKSKGQIDSWLWSFGDGSANNQQNPTHTFLINDSGNARPEIKIMKVILTVVGPGGVDTIKKNLTVFSSGIDKTGNLIE